MTWVLDVFSSQIEGFEVIQSDIFRPDDVLNVFWGHFTNTV